ncbi:MAG: hypothetical protein GVY30_01005 [Chloroflexi bacterium]|jgi:hypothetical protein|nr:hypothetical protein [Chloroflexota bacterium]
MRRKYQLWIWLVLGIGVMFLSSLPVAWARPGQDVHRSSMPTRTPEVGVIATPTPVAVRQGDGGLDVPAEQGTPIAPAEVDAEAQGEAADARVIPPAVNVEDFPSYEAPTDAERPSDAPDAATVEAPLASSEGGAAVPGVDAPEHSQEQASGEATLSGLPQVWGAPAAASSEGRGWLALHQVLGMGLLMVGGIALFIAQRRQS